MTHHRTATASKRTLTLFTKATSKWTKIVTEQFSQIKNFFFFLKSRKHNYNIHISNYASYVSIHVQVFRRVPKNNTIILQYISFRTKKRQWCINTRTIHTIWNAKVKTEHAIWNAKVKTEHATCRWFQPHVAEGLGHYHRNWNGWFNIIPQMLSLHSSYVLLQSNRKHDLMFVFKG